MDISDTITAIATPPGRGGIGIIRVSGTRALEAMQKLFRSKNKYASPEPNKLYYGYIFDLKSNIIDSGYAVFMRAPCSYTGEDTVEFHCHGSPAVLAKIILCLNEIGVRNAEPGEFTRRAFLNGKIDILQAEAVLDLINANCENASMIAFSQLKGDLSGRIEKLKKEVIRVLSNLDAIIDFPESVDEEMDLLLKDTENTLNGIKMEILGLLSSYRTGRVLREGLLFQMVGKPNAGKSSIFNAILGRDRAIVHPSPGTTRDYIEEEIVLNGHLLRLVDSAGIWDPKGEIEEAGIMKTMEIFKEADAFIFVIDSSGQIDAIDRTLIDKLLGRRGIVALNKTDLKISIEREAISQLIPEWRIICTSAKTGIGIDELKSEIIRLSQELTPGFERGIITQARHYECLRKSLDGIKSAVNILKSSGDIVSCSDEIRMALRYLGELTGEELNEEVLDRIFSQFCIGK